MIIIFALIAAYVLLVLAFAAMVINENKKRLNDDNDKIDEAALLECDCISRKDMDYELCEYPFYDCYKSSN